MQAQAVAPRALASNLSLERVAASPQFSDQEKTAAASQAFEAVLLRQILDTAQKPAFPSASTDRSTAGGIYRDMVNTQLADNIARSGSFGLGRSLTPQLHSLAAKQAQSKSPGPTPAAASPALSTAHPHGHGAPLQAWAARPHRARTELDAPC